MRGATTSRRGRLLAAATAVLAAAGALTGLLTLLPAPSPAAPAHPVAATSPTRTGPAAASTGTAPARAPARQRAAQPATSTVPVPVPSSGLPASRPVTVTVPAIGVASPPIAPLGLTARRALEVPGDAATAGWFTGSPAPGARGPAVLAGHVNYNGTPGVFGRLGELHAGDTATVARADGIRAAFTVDRVAHYPKATFPTRRVYGDTAGPQLRLITCGGAYDPARRSYMDNIVVYAHLSGAYRVSGG